MASLSGNRPNIWMIATSVLFVHGAVALYVAWDFAPPQKPSTARRQVVVRTVTLAERDGGMKAETPVSATAKLSSKPATVSRAPAKALAKASAKPQPAKAQTTAKPTIPVSSARTAAVEKARASLAQLQPTVEANSSVASVPIELVVPTLSTTPMTPTESVVEPSYSDEMTTRLRTLLKLPEYGAVKVKLVLKRTGYVSSVEVLEAESQTNRHYVETGLPSLKFANFGKFFPGEDEHTFTLVLSNDL